MKLIQTHGWFREAGNEGRWETKQRDEWRERESKMGGGDRRNDTADEALSDGGRCRPGGNQTIEGGEIFML